MHKLIKQVEKKRLETIKLLDNPNLKGKHRNFLEGLIAGLDYLLITIIRGEND